MYRIVGMAHKCAMPTRELMEIRQHRRISIGYTQFRYAASRRALHENKRNRKGFLLALGTHFCIQKCTGREVGSLRSTHFAPILHISLWFTAYKVVGRKPVASNKATSKERRDQELKSKKKSWLYLISLSFETRTLRRVPRYAHSCPQSPGGLTCPCGTEGVFPERFRVGWATRSTFLFGAHVFSHPWN